MVTGQISSYGCEGWLGATLRYVVMEGVSAVLEPIPMQLAGQAVIKPGKTNHNSGVLVVFCISGGALASHEPAYTMAAIGLEEETLSMP